MILMQFFLDFLLSLKDFYYVIFIALINTIVI